MQFDCSSNWQLNPSASELFVFVVLSFKDGIANAIKMMRNMYVEIYKMKWIVP